jgi:2-polyprenyl-3-methyl-5-hydroxy-6-metoxy-1,4-benzoquinol methylase
MNPLLDRFANLRTDANERFFHAVASYYERIADLPVVEMYFTYALSTNERGRVVAELTERHKSIAGCSYLDIGCAYAGFLVAFAERGAKVMGIEIDASLIDLGKENLAAAGLDSIILQKDATRIEQLVELINRFDIITCNDVIEHVDNPAALVENISLMLRRGGAAYLEIPNRNHPRFVLEDGHYMLFGITLLDLPEAELYYKTLRPQGIYNTRFYLELDQYESLFNRVGLSLTLLPETFDLISVESTRNDLATLRQCADEKLSTVPEVVRGKVEQRISEYLKTVDGYSKDDFLTRYGPSFWKLMATKD